jgi:alkylhydroperoxidase/carboxymuconolactone decarboxylase family protein YurZ
MAKELVRSPSEYLMKESTAVGTALRDLRNAVLAAGPLDGTTSELIVISNFAMAGYEESFKIHSRRLISSGVPFAALKQAVLLPLGATAGAYQAARAIEWIDQLEAESSAHE